MTTRDDVTVDVAEVPTAPRRPRLWLPSVAAAGAFVLGGILGLGMASGGDTVDVATTAEYRELEVRLAAQEQRANDAESALDDAESSLAEREAQVAEREESVTQWLIRQDAGITSQADPGAEPSSNAQTGQPGDPVPPPSGYGFPGSVRLGDSGAAVLAWQEWLIHAGVISDIPENHDGVFGPGTEKAVRDYQQQWGLTVDGVAGYETWMHVSESLTHGDL